MTSGKGTTYEGGHRVPLIARWPGKIAAGVVISELTSSLDWFPTILNLAGVKLPTDRKIDGVDMHDVLFAQGPFPRTKRKEFLCALAPPNQYNVIPGCEEDIALLHLSSAALTLRCVLLPPRLLPLPLLLLLLVMERCNSDTLSGGRRH